MEQEQPPSSEQEQRREWLVANLKERGYVDEDVRRELLLWFRHQELVRRPEPGSEIDDTIEYALLLKDAGLKDDARRTLEDALMNAWTGFQDEKRCNQIEDMIDGL